MQGRIFAAALALALLAVQPAAAEWRLVGAHCRIVDGRQVCIPAHWHQTHLCCPACGYTPPTAAAAASPAATVAPAAPAIRPSEARPAANAELVDLRRKLDEQAKALGEMAQWRGELAEERRVRAGADRDLATAVTRAREELSRERQTSEGKWTSIVANVSADLRAEIEAAREESTKAPPANVNVGGGPTWWWDVAGAAIAMAAGGAGMGVPVAIGWKLLGMGIGWRRQRRARQRPQQGQESDGAGQGDNGAGGGEESGECRQEIERLNAEIGRRDAMIRAFRERLDQGLTETEFVPVDTAEFQNFYEEVRGMFGRKYPGAVNALENFDGMLKLYIESKKVAK